MKAKTCFILLLMYACIATHVSVADNRNAADGRSDSGAARLEHLAQALELTADQTAALRQQMQASREHLQQLHQERARTKAELEKLFAAVDADEQAVNRAGQRLAELNAEITLQQVQMRQAINRVLTPAQAVRWQQLRRNMQNRHNVQDRQRRSNRRPAGD